MANTTNFNWETPDDTDLVKDGAAAIRTLGSAIDTSLVDLKGGTTGQILSKATNTDMDFTWITNDVGDITEVVASTPLTGGGTSGSVTVGIQDGTTAQKGAVQLEDSTSSTSTTKAATPNSVKSAYDLANGAIAKSIVDAKGDLIVGTADNTVARLASSASDGNVLTVDTSTASGLKWAAPATSSFVGVRCKKSGTQSIANATETLVTWTNTDVFDTDSFHDTSTNTARLTIPAGKDGYYKIYWTTQWGSPNATGRRIVQLYKNGNAAGDIVCSSEVTPNASTYPTNGGSVTAYLVAGDYVQLSAYQDSSGSLNLDASAGQNFGLEKIG